MRTAEYLFVTALAVLFAIMVATTAAAIIETNLNKVGEVLNQQGE